MLVQDQLFDRDGASIVIGKGYLDNPKDEGIASIATHLLDSIAFGDKAILKNLKDYYGNYNYEIDEYFINFSFDILNNGFKKFLYYFSLILNPQFISTYYEKYIKDIVFQLQYDYISKININNKEWHILQYFVYGLKGDNNEELFPEGNFESISKIDNISELWKKVLEYIYKLIDPANIKITIFSKYKFLISSKYIKKYFHYLTTMEKKVMEKTMKDNLIIKYLINHKYFI